MVTESESQDFSSLGDLVALVGKDKNLKAEVSIKLTKPCPEVEDFQPGKEKLIIESYMLEREYSFIGETGEKKISMSSLLGYFFGTEDESAVAKKMICNAANEHLKVEFQCLKEADVQFEESFIEC
jgi:hypothetical protein